MNLVVENDNILGESVELGILIKFGMVLFEFYFFVKC